MGLSTFTELQAAAAQWLHRTDLAGVLPGAIALAEARMARDLKVQSLEGTATITTVAGTSGYAIPATVVGLIRLFVQIGGRQMPMRSYSAAQFNVSATGLPRCYAFEGGRLVLSPTPDSAYTVAVVHRRALPALGSTTPTNDILVRFPDLYLFATLVELGAYSDDEKKAALWEQRYQSAVQKANRADNFKSQGLLRTDLPGVGSTPNMSPDSLWSTGTPGNPGDGGTGDPSFNPADYFNNQLN